MGRMCRRSFIPTASSISSLGYEPTASRPACAQCNKATVMEPGEGSPDAAPRSRRHTLPSDLTRRFEAVVLWSSTPALSSRTAQRMTALSEAGAPVGWLAPGRIDTLVGQLDPPSSGAAPLVLADSGGTGGAIVDRAGSSRFGEPQRFDLRVLDRAGAALVQALETRGLAAKILPRPISSVRVKIELADRTSRTPTELQRFLLVHGIPGVPHLADLARQSAREAGVGDPRVVVDGSRVEIALEDAGDVALSMVDALWRSGVDPQGLLVIIDGLSGVPHRHAPVTVPDARAATFALVNGGRGVPRSGMIALSGGSGRLHQLLADQLRRRRWGALPDSRTQADWSLVINGLDVETQRVHEALLSLSDGQVGMSGASLTGEQNRRPWVVAGVYDGSGADTHLLTGPVAFELGVSRADPPRRRVLDLRTGTLFETAQVDTSDIESVRFLSLARPTTAVLRARLPHIYRTGATLLPPADDHTYEDGHLGGVRWIRVAASTGGILAAALQTRRTSPRPTDDADTRMAVLDRLAVYQTDASSLPNPSDGVNAVAHAATIGFDRLLTEHRQMWAGRWEDADIVVEGDDELQLAIRFALFHMMASVADSGEAGVGPRGLTGTGYRGHVFWDADTFVLPFLAATHPTAARSMLEYRLQRLPAAIEASRAVGRAGARFPWESARSGRDVTPTSARDRSGRLVAIRTGQLEEHIVSQVAWAACFYVDWTGDDVFARGPCHRILVETARYWASRVRSDEDGTTHIYGVVGPDEYHEPVDDNAFTNCMARWNLRRAAESADRADNDGVALDERQHWIDIAENLYDGYDADTGIYEQFAGFTRLEPLIIEELAPRRPIAADLLLGAERTQGAQVIKQADVLMLHHLLPDEVVAGSLEPNLRYYEPRTAHGSSLSPAIHASLLARARDFDRSLEALRIAARMDLDDLTGSTAQGLHLATMGGLWQALAFGFAGLRPRAGMLHIDPVLPPSWSALELRVRFRGAKVRVRKERAHLSVWSDRPTPVVVGGTPFALGPGTLEFRRRGPRWEPS